MTDLETFVARPDLLNGMASFLAGNRDRLSSTCCHSQCSGGRDAIMLDEFTVTTGQASGDRATETITATRDSFGGW